MSKIYFEVHDINEIGRPEIFMDNKPHPRFGYEKRVIDDTNPTLLSNFQKVASWIKGHCPHLNGEFYCRHDVYHKTHLIVEDGIAYLCYGSHSPGYEWKLSEHGTDYYTQGSLQDSPYRFQGIYGFRNDALEEFLSQWKSIKQQIIAANAVQENVFSNNFEV